MLPRTDILRLNPVGATTPIVAVEAAADPRQQEFERALGGQLGKTMRGEVLSKLGDGSFIVKVADTPARMHLPPSTQPGTTVSLQLVAISPRPTFQFNTQTPNGAAGVAYAEADASFDVPETAQPVRSAAQAASTVHIAAATMAQARAQAQLPPGAGVGQQALASLAAGAQPGRPAGVAASALPTAGQAAAGQAATGKPSSLAALLLSKAPIVPLSLLPSIDPNSTPAQLSAGGRVITDVLATAARDPSPQTAVVARTPLLDPAMPPDARHIAQSLKDAIGRSGLFYESHLREWSTGERPLAEIAREPQMQRAAEGTPPRNPATDPASAGFVNLQLATQEQGRITLLGQLLPGQPVEWQIEREDDARDGQARDEGEPAWRSGMKFRFEGLGEIAATVVLSGGIVHLSLDTGSAETAELLRRRSHELGHSLEAAGAQLASLTVRGASSDG